MMYSSQIQSIQNKIHKIEKEYLDWVISGCQNKKGHKDTFMLRIELRGLRDYINEILEKEEGESQ